MEPVDRLYPSDFMRIQVKNTFLEVESDSDDSLDIDSSFARASTEPAKKAMPVKITKCLGGTPAEAFPGAQYQYSGPPSQMPYQVPGGLTTSWGADHPPQAQTSQGGWIQNGVRALESDPDLAPVFEKIRLGGMDAALRLCQDEDLMRAISYKMGSLKKDAGGMEQRQPMGAQMGHSLMSTAPISGCPPAAAPAAVPAFHLGNAVTASGLPPPSVGGPPLSNSLVQEALSQIISKATCSVTVADPSLDDCPLISCTDGFEALTGYRRSEILGRNCRFLNQGLNMDMNSRKALWQTVHHGTDFIGILQNRKKNGELFSNFLCMTPMLLRGKNYIIGVQADAASEWIDLKNPIHMQKIRNLAQILPAKLEAYIQTQAQDYYRREQTLSIPMTLQEQSVLPQGQPFEGQPFTPEITKPSRKGRKSELVPTKVGDHFSRGVSSTSEQSTIAPSVDEGGAGTDGCEFAGGPRTPGVQMMEAPSPGGTEPLKSIGSKGHPDECHSECIFYFFRNGCNAGADCRFCHEFHWRKNMKKNRRILKRLATQPGVAEDDLASPPELMGQSPAGAVLA